MGHADQYAPGDFNAICSVCGSKYKFSELTRHWQGMYRCRNCWEPRHPQDFVTTLRGDEMQVPQVQKDTDVDILAPAFPASGTPVTNTYAFSIIAFWYPDSTDFTDVKVNGVSIGATKTQATVPAGQTIQFTYTGRTPFWTWTGAFQTTIGVDGI